MDLRDRSVLVTGAGGFVGGYAARRLAETEGMLVRALVRDRGKGALMDLNHPRIQVLQGDVLDPAAMDAASSGCDLLVHAAASLRPVRRKVAWATWVQGTRNVYDSARRAGVRRFIFLSSFAVYFGVKEWRYDESVPLAGSSDLYASGKIAAEELLRGAAPGGPEVFILRPPAIYGPHSRFSIWFARAAGENRLFLPGGGQSGFAYLFIDNLIDAIVAACRTTVPGGVYNIFDGRLPYRSFVEPYHRAAGTRPRNIPFWFLHSLAAAGDFLARASGWWIWVSGPAVEYLRSGYDRVAASARAAERDLGWSPRVDFEEGTRRTLLWLDQTANLPQ